MSKIPKKIYQVWMQGELPEYVKNNIVDKNTDYEYFFFTEYDCLQYLKTHYKESILTTFLNLKNPAHKCDLFRYCLLYKDGGIYIDADLELRITCNDIIKESEYSEMITSIGAHTNKHFGECTNGFIFTVPNNTLFIHLINFIMNNPNPVDYGLYVKDLFNKLSPVSLFNPYTKDGVCYYLFKEVLLNKKYYITNKQQELIVNTNAHNYLVWNK